MQQIYFVLTGMGKEMHTGMILTELQKVFDTLENQILLEKKTCLGFQTPVVPWFESHLSNRKFFISADVFSEAGILNCRDPRGPLWDHSCF